MKTGLDLTFEVMAKTQNEAALPWLIELLTSARPELQCGAMLALLGRRTGTGHLEVLRRWNSLTESQLQLVDQNPNRISLALRDGVLSSDVELNRNACAAAVRLREYDLIPTLVRAAEDKANPHTDLAAEAVVSLAEHLHQELAAPRDYRNRRDPALVRQFVHSALEQSVRYFARHRRTPLVEAYLMLVNKDDSLLKHLLNEPNEVAYAAVISLLTNSQRPGIVRLLLELLALHHTPTTVLHVASRRRDEYFLHQLLVRFTAKPTAAVKNNLRKVETWAWLRDDVYCLADMSDEDLCGAVRLVTASGMSRIRAFEVVKFAMQNGQVFSRRAAAECLAEFKGGEANDLAVLALSDHDPLVQSHAAAQLRERGIPGALHRLVDLLSSPHEVVREAVQSALGEFTFQRYVSAFELLDGEARNITGSLVKRIDPDAIGQLQVELTSLSRSRRIRGLDLAIAMQATREVEEEILALSCDSDHFIRAASARALARTNAPKSRQRLQELQLDRTISVQQAATEALAAADLVPDPFVVVPEMTRFPTPLSTTTE